MQAPACAERRSTGTAPVDLQFVDRPLPPLRAARLPHPEGPAPVRRQVQHARRIRPPGRQSAEQAGRNEPEKSVIRVPSAASDSTARPRGIIAHAKAAGQDHQPAGVEFFLERHPHPLRARPGAPPTAISCRCRRRRHSAACPAWRKPSPSTPGPSRGSSADSSTGRRGRGAPRSQPTVSLNGLPCAPAAPSIASTRSFGSAIPAPADRSTAAGAARCTGRRWPAGRRAGRGARPGRRAATRARRGSPAGRSHTRCSR